MLQPKVGLMQTGSHDLILVMLGSGHQLRGGGGSRKRDGGGGGSEVLPLQKGGGSFSHPEGDTKSFSVVFTWVLEVLTILDVCVCV